MATESELLAAVLAHPDEDTPRLALADFLDEQGEPEQRDRTEFIRLQIQQEHHTDGFLPPPARERLMALNRQYRKAWVPKVPKGFDAWEYHRGFVERVSCDAGSFLRRGEKLASVMPFRRVHFTAPADDLSAVAESPLLARVRTLSVGETKLSTALLLELCRSPHLTGLVDLVSYLNDHDDDTLAQLAGCERLSGLRKLDLWGNRAITAAGAAALADSPHLGSLRDFNVPCNSLGSEGLTAVARGRVTRTITALHLWDCEIGPVGVEALAACPDFRLVHLSLSHNPIGPRGAAALAGCGAARALRELSVTECDLGADGAAHLGRSRALGGLRDLLCAKNAIGPRGAAALLGRGGFAGLWNLNLDENAIGDAGMTALANAAGDELWWLSLVRNDIGDAGMTALANSPRLRGVSNLNLYGNRIGDAGAVALAQSPHLTNLKWLHVRNNRIGEKGAQALAESPHVCPGEAISLDGNRVPKKAQRELRKRFPGRLDFSA